MFSDLNGALFCNRGLVFLCCTWKKGLWAPVWSRINFHQQSHPVAKGFPQGAFGRFFTVKIRQELQTLSCAAQFKSDNISQQYHIFFPLLTNKKKRCGWCLSPHICLAVSVWPVRSRQPWESKTQVPKYF